MVNHAQAQAAQAAAVLQAQQRQQSAAAAAMQIAAAAVGQPPPAAHGGSQPSSGNPGTPSSFRAGSIMTGRMYIYDVLQDSSFIIGIFFTVLNMTT